MPPLKVGLIGCGNIAQAVHLGILTSLSGVELVALAEPDPQRRAKASRREPAAAAFADYEELLQMPVVEAVVICLPSWLHAEAAIAALNCGKHLYLEKPLATNLADADRVIAVWRRSEVKAMIGFNFRFNPLHLEARALLHGGRIGEVIGVRSIFSARGEGLPAWLQARKTGGGALLEQASHHFDLLPYLLGSRIREVDATIRSLITEDDHAVVTLRLENDTVAQSLFFFSPLQEDRFDVYGRQGKLIIDRFRSLSVEVGENFDVTCRFRRLRHALGTIMRSRLLGDDLLAPKRERSYAAALSYFVDCVRHDRMPSPDLLDGRRSLSIVEAAEESARTGYPVSVSDLAHEDFAR